MENRSSTTADLQLGLHGDFTIRDTVFHVTVSPMPAVIEKCAATVRQRFRTLLLVPEGRLDAARQLAEISAPGAPIGILPIETFIGQNIEEVSEFSRADLGRNVRRLLELYNERVERVETDRSLLIEIPDNL